MLESFADLIAARTKMMRTKHRHALYAAALALSLAGAPSLAATIVYDNTVPNNTLGTFVTNIEIGDEITLAGTHRTVTEFRFGYDGDFDPPGSEPGEGAWAQVRFYGFVEGDPPGPGPGESSLIWESALFPLAPKASLFDYVLGVPSITVPDTFTWTVEFSGISDGDSVRLLRYKTPAVGSSGEYWWDKAGGTWNVRRQSGSSNNFRSRVSAVPEPTTALLLALGLTALAASRRRSA